MTVSTCLLAVTLQWHYWGAVFATRKFQCARAIGGNVFMKSKRSVLANGFAGNERDLARARTCGLPMVILYLLGFCALPSAARAQVPVYEVTPVESTIKFYVESSVPLKGNF